MLFNEIVVVLLACARDIGFYSPFALFAFRPFPFWRFAVDYYTTHFIFYQALLCYFLGFYENGNDFGSKWQGKS